MCKTTTQIKKTTYKLKADKLKELRTTEKRENGTNQVKKKERERKKEILVELKNGLLDIIDECSTYRSPSDRLCGHQVRSFEDGEER